MRRTPLAFLFLLGACAILAIVLSRSPESPADDARVQAFRVCHAAAKARLKAPASAKFPNPNSAGVESSIFNKASDFRGQSIPAGSRHVASYVDAQNAFDALIRTHFDCLIDQSGRVLVIEFR